MHAAIRSLKNFPNQALTWFGIFGGAITLVACMRGVVEQAELTSIIVGAWAVLLSHFGT